jgi:cell division protein FtsW (lipid II flippase)
LAQVIPIGEGHLRRVVREFVEHYHGERNHQGIGSLLRYVRYAAAGAAGLLVAPQLFVQLGLAAGLIPPRAISLP